jgi:CheY-like chemotaxis protein
LNKRPSEVEPRVEQEQEIERSWEDRLKTFNNESSPQGEQQREIVEDWISASLPKSEHLEANNLHPSPATEDPPDSSKKAASLKDETSFEHPEPVPSIQGESEIQIQNAEQEQVDVKGKAPERHVDIFKSFRVAMDDPCSKVLPAALKKYNIQDDWRKYALYIVMGDDERFIGMNERPLLIFKELGKQGKKPIFMLRKLAKVADDEGLKVRGASELPNDEPETTLHSQVPVNEDNKAQLDRPKYRPLDILIATGESAVRQHVETKLDQLSCRTVSANSAKTALQLLISEGRFDMIFISDRSSDIVGEDIGRTIRRPGHPNNATPLVHMTPVPVAFYLDKSPYDAEVLLPLHGPVLVEILAKYCNWKPPPEYTGLRASSRLGHVDNAAGPVFDRPRSFREDTAARYNEALDGLRDEAKRDYEAYLAASQAHVDTHREQAASAAAYVASHNINPPALLPRTAGQTPLELQRAGRYTAGVDAEGNYHGAANLGSSLSTRQAMERIQAEADASKEYVDVFDLPTFRFRNIEGDSTS